MDRRRYVPSSEGLEDRQLLSIFSPPKGSSYNLLTQTQTLSQKNFHISRLPAYLRSVNPGKRIDLPPVVADIQEDLNAIKARLHAASEPARTNFELTLRNAIDNASLSQKDAASLSNAFGLALRSAGADEAITAKFQQDMNTLALVDANEPNPVMLATNDYAIVLETALAIGRPLRTPAAPRLQASDDSGAKGDNTTFVRQPHLAGSYDAGATINIVDASGRVLGTATVGVNNRYSVQFAKPLAVGTHVVGVQAVEGEVTSALSPTITLNIVERPATAVPKGPQALK